MSERPESKAFKLTIYPGSSCDASAEVQPMGEIGGTVAADVEVCCDHCYLLQSFFRQGDSDSVFHDSREQMQLILTSQCKKLIEHKIDPANIPQGFLPTVGVADSTDL